MYRALGLASLLLAWSCSSPIEHDVILRNGLLIDGSGTAGYVGDLGIDGNRIAAIGDLGHAVGCCRRYCQVEADRSF